MPDPAYVLGLAYKLKVLLPPLLIHGLVVIGAWPQQVKCGGNWRNDGSGEPIHVLAYGVSFSNRRRAPSGVLRTTAEVALDLGAYGSGRLDPSFLDLSDATALPILSHPMLFSLQPA